MSSLITRAPEYGAEADLLSAANPIDPPGLYAFSPSSSSLYSFTVSNTAWMGSWGLIGPLTGHLAEAHNRFLGTTLWLQRLKRLLTTQATYLCVRAASTLNPFVSCYRAHLVALPASPGLFCILRRP